MEILERLVKRLIEGEDGKLKEETTRVGEQIDPEKDVYPSGNKYIMTHPGIRKLARWVGAYWSDIDIVDVPTKENDRGYGVRAKCVFPDGSVSISTGSANDKNTIDKKNPKNTISNDYKLEMAEKRGADRAFLRSNYIGFFDVYSDQESTSFQEEETNKMPKKVMQKDPEMPEVKDLIKYVELPENDEKYPEEKVYNVWKVHQDKEYIEELTKHETKEIRFIAKGILKKIKQTETNENKEEQSA